LDIKDTYQVLQMAYIFDFESFQIRIQEQRDGKELPSHECKMIDRAEVRVGSGYNIKNAFMVTFGVDKGNSLHVTTTFRGAPFEKLQKIEGRYLGERHTLSDSDSVYDVSKNDFSIEPAKFRSNSSNGVVVHAHGEVLGIFCKVITGRDTVVEGDQISFDHAVCYRELKNISPVSANPIVHKTSDHTLSDTQYKQYLLAIEENLTRQTDLILKSTQELQSKLDLCDRRVQRMEKYFPGMEDLAKQQTNLILSKITESDTQISTSTKHVNDLMAYMDRMLAVTRDSQTAITAIKEISSANARSIKVAVNAINMNVCKLFQQQQKSYKIEEITLQPFNAKFSV